MGRQQVQKERVTKKRETELAALGKPDSHEDLKHEMDNLLDEIDSVLEENAEEFVKSYVQKGGE